MKLELEINKKSLPSMEDLNELDIFELLDFYAEIEKCISCLEGMVINTGDIDDE